MVREGPSMDAEFADLDSAVLFQTILGYLNFSEVKPDARVQKQINDAYAFVAERSDEKPWVSVGAALSGKLDALKAGGIGAFRDTTQASAVLELGFQRVLPAYRHHHGTLLFHLDDGDLFQPYFLARVLEAVLAQGAPWDEADRIVAGAVNQLNDFVGYRPVAVLESRPKGEPYDHERVRPIPLYLRGAGVAWGRYRELVAKALEILGGVETDILAEAGLDP